MTNVTTLLKINNNLWVSPSQVCGVLTTGDVFSVVVGRAVRIVMHGQCFFVEQCETEEAAQNRAAEIAKAINEARNVR